MKNIDIVKIKLERDKKTRKKYDTKINNSIDTYEVLRDLLEYEDKETFLVISLNTRNYINGINVVSVGSISSSEVHPREVFKMAILNNSHSIIIAHNHPSGSTEPSKEDIHLTDRLVECGKILGIEVLDHIIIGDEEYYSFRENKKLNIKYVKRR